MRISLFIAMFLTSAVVAEEPAGENSEVVETSPSEFFNRDWYAENGVELPRQFGIGYNLINMKRDIEVVDVNVSFLNQPTQSVSDLSDFEVENKTSHSMARIFPELERNCRTKADYGFVRIDAES